MAIGKQAHLRYLQLIPSQAKRLQSDSLLRNSIFIMGSTVITSFIGYLYWIVAVHLYSANDIGLVSAVISATTLTSSLANPGIGSFLIQALPQRNAGRDWSITLNTGITVGTLTSLIAGIVVAIALPFFSNQFAILGHNIIYTIAFIVGVPLWTVTILLDQTFVAERATGNMLVRNVVFSILKLLLMILLAEIGVFGIFSSWVLALAISVIISGWLLIPRLKRAYNITVHGIIQQVRPMLSSLAWHHFTNLGSTLPMYLLPIFVTVGLSATANAYFYTAWMLGSIFFMISPAVATSLFAEGSHSTDDVLRKAKSSAIIIGALLGPAMLAVFFGGHYILLLFGQNYAEHSLSLLIILSVSAVPDAITNIYVSVLRIQKRLRFAAFVNLGMAFLTLLLALILLPPLGIVGVGWAFFISQGTGSLVALAEFVFMHAKHQSIVNIAPSTTKQQNIVDKPTVNTTPFTVEQQKIADEPTLKFASIIIETKDIQQLAKKNVLPKVPKKVVFHKIT